MAYPIPAAYLGEISAGWRYSGGGDHFAYDYAVPIGTPLYAVQDGVILDCADGAPNQPRGVKRKRSNWILLGFEHNGEKATAYYQHLSPNLSVRQGQRVKAGQLIGRSGNTGWSSGPHLHLATGFGHWTEATRYAYMSNDGRNDIVIFAPSKVYPKPSTITSLAPSTKLGRVGWQVSDLRWVLYKAGYLSRRYTPGQAGVESDKYDGNVGAAVKRWHESPSGKKFRGSGDIRQIGPAGWKGVQWQAGRR
jgi:murein DD-endopeptidase MepM/ murein hydrolase activator NlpD